MNANLTPKDINILLAEHFLFITQNLIFRLFSQRQSTIKFTSEFNSSDYSVLNVKITDCTLPRARYIKHKALLTDFSWWSVLCFHLSHGRLPLCKNNKM